MGNDVSFYLNGERVTIQDPSPQLMLVDYLRSPQVGLAGTKKPCGQGGCGGCTVILSEEVDGAPQHRAINSCLRPVCALSGLSITTIEGTGTPPAPSSAHVMHTATASRAAAPLDMPLPPAIAEAVAEARAGDLWDPQTAASRPDADDVELDEERLVEGMNPVAHRLALHNGSQCGYCTVGFVMNMSEFRINNPKATMREIEDIFDGNLCRCTGYRTILTGMKTFGSDFKEDLTNPDTIQCLIPANIPAGQTPAKEPQIRFVQPKPEDKIAAVVTAGNDEWATPSTLGALADLMAAPEKPFRLVHGNTSYGIYKDEFTFPKAYRLIDIRSIPELNRAPVVTETALTVSAGISYSDLLIELDKLLLPPKNPPAFPFHGDLGSFSVQALRLMVRRTAGRIVRNAASLGGNAMLVLHHIAQNTGEPFPSDLFTVLYAIGAKIKYQELSSAGTFAEKTLSAEALVAAIKSTPVLANKIVLASFELPITNNTTTICLAQKVASREVNSHTIVNATTVLTFGNDNKVAAARLVFGGIEAAPWRAGGTEALLIGPHLTLGDVKRLAEALAGEAKKALDGQATRMAGLPTEGLTLEYRKDLAVSFLYKALVHALRVKNLINENGSEAEKKILSGGNVTWGSWLTSGGVQRYKSRSEYRPVGDPFIKTSALYQASGQIRYTQEQPVSPRTVNGAFVQSRRALGTFSLQLPTGTATTADGLRNHMREKFPGAFTDYVDNKDVPSLNLQGMGLDQPLFAEKTVMYYGQSIGLVLAQTEQDAIRIAKYVSDHCITYQNVTWQAPFDKPILTIEEAVKANSIFPDAPSTAHWPSHIWKITRPGSVWNWMLTPRTDLKERPPVPQAKTVDGQAYVVVESLQRTGGQAHFYMETQACIAEPQDEGRIRILSSSQSPMEMHQTTAMALGVHYNNVEVQIPPVGGGFGGKTEQARFVTGAAAVAARKAKRPVRIAMPRDEDTAMIGKRHAYLGQCQVAVDKTTKKIHGFHATMWGDGGAFYDCSFIVSNCIQLRADNAYNVKNFESVIDVCRTNTAPSTAMRAFGDIQGKNIIENAIEDAAIAVGLQPHELREANFYKPGDETPFGQKMEVCYIENVWNYLKTTCKFDDQRVAVEKFNSENKWRKQGISILPVKYGSGYNLVQLEQATAVLSVNQADGTIVIHQGGVEMGQGLVTQALQVASKILNIPMDMINIAPVRTSVIPNPSSSGASTGTPYACEVVKLICGAFVRKLNDFIERTKNERPEDFLKYGFENWLFDSSLDSWYYPGVTTEKPQVKDCVSLWQKIVQYAYQQRFDLVTAFTAPIGNALSDDGVKTMTFKPYAEQPKNLPGITPDNATLGGGVDQFAGFTYSAACSVVEVDILTGESKILRSDIVYDMGWTLNPALDIGQVEGAFIQGVGFLTSENLVFEPLTNEVGAVKVDAGRLNTVNTWRYKIPAHCSIPLEFNVHLYPGTNENKASEDATTVFSAKEVGEPPLVLANTVFFAIKAAIRASRKERGLDEFFKLDAPATVQEVRSACDVTTAHLA